MTNQKKYLHFYFLIPIFLILFLTGCKNRLSQNDFDYITEWSKVEENYYIKNSEGFVKSLESFKNDIKDYQNSPEYTTLVYLRSDLAIDNDNLSLYLTKKINDTLQNFKYTDIDSPETQAFVYTIRSCIYRIHEIDDANSIASGQINFFILTVLIIIILIISAFLFLIVIKFEREKESLEELSTYSGIVIDGIEKERKRISKEIHDTVIQDIKAIQLENETFCSTGNSEAPSENKIYNEKIKFLADRSIKQLRSICHNLTPNEIKESIITAITNYSRQFESDSKINVNLKIEDDIYIGNLSTQKNLHIFRIVHEALSNAQRHAKAENVSILIRNKKQTENGKTRTSLIIFIMDDGCGFSIEQLDKMENHFGIRNMKERAQIINGKLDIISELGEGTEITLEVPLDE